jgi:hypothetical protein
VIIREICPQPVGQGRCELVFYVALEKHFPVAEYPALESSDCHRSHVCVFVWACLKIDFAKRLDFLKRGRINVEESAGGDLSYIRSPRNAACQQGFGRLLHSKVVFEHDRMNCMRHFGISHYFAELDRCMILLCLVGAEGSGRTRRSIDAAIFKEPTYGRDCRLPNGIYRQRISYRTCVPRR